MTSYNRLILSGTLFQSERWSVGIAYKRIFGGAPDAVLEDYDELLDWAQRVRDVKFETGTPGRALLGYIGNIGSLDTVRTEYRESGVLLQAAEATGVPIPGTGTATRPPQVAVVCSLLTGRPGRSYRGRIYWPATAGPTLGTNGMMAPSLAVTMAGQFAEALPQFGERSFGYDLMPGVYSPKLDEFTVVSSVSVGTALDTQRRRRDAFVESYAEEPVENA